MTRLSIAIALLCTVAAGCAEPQPSLRTWVAGDHHIHSRYSVSWDREVDPPLPIVGGGSPVYPIPMNAVMARHFGLSWMVATDHGGPNHSKVNLELAYPELQMSREAVPDLVQFYGMELDTPEAEHSSLIIPYSQDESGALYDIEEGFAKLDAHPRDPARDTEAKMIEALTFMRELALPPVVIVNHASRTATGLGVYGRNDPAELRGWNDAAPEIAVGMAGAPGHQASTLNPDGSVDDAGSRGGYGNYPTMGGFDQMTARLGGFWDSMLGEGRHWWITANSDSHKNWRDGGSDFWPGEYSKTYVFAEKSHDDILEGIRNGRVFVTTGDLVSELFVTASVDGAEASIGGELPVPAGADVTITVRVRDPRDPNSHGDTPTVARVDIITGDVGGILADPTQDTNPTTRVARRLTESDWVQDGEYLALTYVLENVDRGMYVRVRGTNTAELEPEPDPPGEDPWSDLWFYSNPIFLSIR